MAESSNFLTFFIVLQIAASILMFPFFKATGKPKWAAFVPFYRTWILLDVVGRPKWWIILTMLPVANNVIAIVLVYELLHVFNFRKTSHTVYSVLTLGVYLGYIGYNQNLKYVGRDVADMKNRIGETFPNILYAIIVATIIRAFTFEAYTIPTSSMEKSLLVGDFLFVSKMHYGVRVPMTPLSIPLLHNTIPRTELKSYSEAVKLPYMRIPKFYDVKRNDPVVFNYPMETAKPVDFPVDKRTHYVKRCVGVAGDVLEVRDGSVYINGEKEELPDRAMRAQYYYVKTNGAPLNKKMLKEKYNMNILVGADAYKYRGESDMIDISLDMLLLNIPDQYVEEFREMSWVEKVVPAIMPRPGENFSAEIPLPVQQKMVQHSGGIMFPNGDHDHSGKLPVFKFSRDNYGPIYIPRKGDVIELNDSTVMLYGRAIQVYEGNSLSRRGNQFLLNGEPATEYTMKQNYFWMMGDNRHNSADSRMWGFVPEDHIVGKPVFIWMSWEKHAKGLKKIRTDRVFTTVNGEGERVSYFWPFVIFVAAWTAIARYRRRKKSNVNK